MKGKVPWNVDPVKLADKIKRGMTAKFLKDIEELENSKPHSETQS